MLTIAGGIILAIIILAFLPAIFAAGRALFSFIVLIVLILLGINLLIYYPEYASVFLVAIVLLSAFTFLSQIPLVLRKNGGIKLFFKKHIANIGGFGIDGEIKKGVKLELLEIERLENIEKNKGKYEAIGNINLQKLSEKLRNKFKKYSEFCLELDELGLVGLVNKNIIFKISVSCNYPESTRIIYKIFKNGETTICDYPGLSVHLIPSIKKSLIEHRKNISISS